MQTLEASSTTQIMKPLGEKGSAHPRTLMVIGLLVYLLGIYTNASAQIFELQIVGLLGVFGAVLLFLGRNRTNSFENNRSLLYLLIFLVIFTIIGESSLFTERLKSLLQMTTALLCVHVLLNTSREIGRTTLAKILGFFTLVIVIGASAETILPAVRQISDNFREFVFADRFIYDFASRDLLTYGAIRPNFFTQEPSHVSKAFLSFGASWYLVSENRHKILLLSVGTILLLYFLRSPFVILCLPLAIALRSFMHGGKQIILLLILGLPAIVLLLFAGMEFFSTRIELIQAGRDFSFFSRLIGPYQIALLAWRDGYFFGVGLGGKESLLPYFLEVYYRWSDASYLREMYLGSFNNAAANSLSYFGVFGAIIFYWLLGKFFRDRLVALGIILLFFQLDGALEGVRIWGYIAVLLAAYQLSKRSRGVSNSQSQIRRPVRVAFRT